MIDRSEAIDLINELSGEEYDWVDLKEDYYVLGIDFKKAEFIKDVVSMANTTTNRDNHYIIIGVEDTSGDLVGIDSGYDDTSPPRHILGLDESNIQKELTEYISPTPNVTIHKFTDENPKFGILSINQIKKKPCVIQKSIDSGGDRKLQKGLIYFRSGSSNTIALRGDIDRIIDERVEARREEILDGIQKATEIGPEAVGTVGDLVHQEDGEIVVEVGDEGDFVMEERFSREPVSDIDERLTLDMKRWATTGSIAIDADSLWEYYSASDKISIDEQSVLFLTKASLSEKMYGGFWLTYTDTNTIRDILFSSSGGYHRNKTISKILSAVGDCEGLREFYNQNSINTSLNSFSDYLKYCDNTADQRLDSLLSGDTHNIGYSEWSDSIDPRTMEKTDLREKISILSKHMKTLNDRSTGYDSWYDKYDNFREVLKEVELALLIKTNDNSL